MQNKVTSSERKLILDSETRRIVCGESFRLFFFTYFGHYADVPSADFHYDMFEDLKFRDGLRFLVWIMFRGSAKTTIVRAYIAWCILFKKKKNIIWVSNDKAMAEKNARAIANELQANPYILADFGQMYYESSRHKEERKSSPKKILEFKAKNGIMFSATTTNISGRGLLEATDRPDLYVFDDIETDKTKRSKVVTKKNIENTEERITGAAPEAQFIFLCNYITKYGYVAYLLRLAKESKRWFVRWKKLIENGEITWPARIVWTEVEKKKGQESVEGLKQDTATDRFNQERLLVPMEDGGGVIKEEWFDGSRGHYASWRLIKEGDNWFYNDGEKRYPVKTFTGVDPAISQKQGSDERAIESVGYVDIGERSLFLVMGDKAGIWSLHLFTEELKKEKARVCPMKTGVESNGTQETFRVVFGDAGISTVPVNPKGNKYERLSEFLADFEYGRILFPDDGSCDKVKYECISFTGEQGGKDNRVDALVHALKLAKDSKSSVPNFSVS